MTTPGSPFITNETNVLNLFSTQHFCYCCCCCGCCCWCCCFYSFFICTDLFIYLIFFAFLIYFSFVSHSYFSYIFSAAIYAQLQHQYCKRSVVLISCLHVCFFSLSLSLWPLFLAYYGQQNKIPSRNDWTMGEKTAKCKKIKLDQDCQQQCWCRLMRYPHKQINFISVVNQSKC